MPRLERAVAAGLPHRITQRGNYRQEVFRNDGDRATCLGLIPEYCKPARLRLIAYCPSSLPSVTPSSTFPRSH